MRSRTRFTDRKQAGMLLADELLRFADENPLVLALPRGGVPVAAEVAGALNTDLDVVVVRKIGCPWQPELGVGAVGEDGVRILNAGLISKLGMTAAQLDRVAEAETQEVHRRLARYRSGRPAREVAGRTTILVDDGVATGSTAMAAAKILRNKGARRIVVAAPVAPADGPGRLGETADEVVILALPTNFVAIGQFYEDFTQVSDEDVTALLTQASERVRIAET